MGCAFDNDHVNGISISMGNTGILVCESIFENPVLIDSILGCRNKSARGVFGIVWAGFGIGLGFWVAREHPSGLAS